MPNTLALVLGYVLVALGALALALGVLRGFRAFNKPATTPKAYAYPLAARSPNVARTLDKAEAALSDILFTPEIQMRLGMTSSDAKDLQFALDLVIRLRARA